MESFYETNFFFYKTKNKPVRKVSPVVCQCVYFLFNLEDTSRCQNNCILHHDKVSDSEVE